MAVRDMMCSTVGSGPRDDPTLSGADDGSRSGGDEESTARECGAAGADLVLLCVFVCVCGKRAAVYGQRCAVFVFAPVAHGGSAGRDIIKFRQHILGSKATCARHVWVTHSNFN